MSFSRLFFPLFGLFVIPISACSGPAPITAPSYSASSVANEAFSQFDSNKDGKLDEKELASVPSLKNSLADLDKDRDKAISKDELETRLKEMLESRVGVQAVSCRVMRAGQPVSDVEVKLTPEAFFGKALQPARGKSDANGNVAIRCEGQSADGAAPGFYRVEASLKGANGNESLPASVNAQTKLGYQIGSHLRGGIEINLP